MKLILTSDPPRSPFHLLQYRRCGMWLHVVLFISPRDAHVTAAILVELTKSHAGPQYFNKNLSPFHLLQYRRCGMWLHIVLFISPRDARTHAYHSSYLIEFTKSRTRVVNNLVKSLNNLFRSQRSEESCSLN